MSTDRAWEPRWRGKIEAELERLRQIHGLEPLPWPPPDGPPVEATLLDRLFPPTRVRLGAYNQTPAGDAAFAALVGVLQANATTYHGMGDGRTYEPNHRARIAAGITPVISIQTRIGTEHVQHADIAAGEVTELLIADVEAIAELDADVVVPFGQEHDVWANKGVQRGTPEDFARAQELFVGILRARAPRALALHWCGNPANNGARYLPDPALVDLRGCDPYKWKGHPLDETAWQTWRGRLIAALEAWGELPMILPETGADIADYGDANAAAWWRTVPAAIAEARTLLDFRGLSLFNRYPWTIDASTPLTLEAYRELAVDLAA